MKERPLEKFYVENPHLEKTVEVQYAGDLHVFKPGEGRVFDSDFALKLIAHSKVGDDFRLTYKAVK